MPKLTSSDFIKNKLRKMFVPVKQGCSRKSASKTPNPENVEKIFRLKCKALFYTAIFKNTDFS